MSMRVSGRQTLPHRRDTYRCKTSDGRRGPSDQLACGPIFSYTLPRNTACSVSGTGRKLVRKSSARSQARKAARPPTAAVTRGR